MDEVSRRPPVDLSSDTLHDILAFFDRKCLSRQRSVNSRFNRTIRLGFANTPYLVFEELEILEYTNKKSICGKGRNIADEVMVDQILAEKFVRFKHADVMSGDRAYIMNVFSTSEPWQTFDLMLTEEFKLTKYNARRLAKCKKVNSISLCGRLTLLPELLLGNCRNLERFTSATTRLHFEFYWFSDDAQLFHSDVKVKNIHTSQKLILDQTNFYDDDSNSSYIQLYTV
ncbi:hypothetical protein Ddc_18730 [Ditylenchus destructor]|nr:hypothetical protein Ddc_18730 [Ditylenchus destructor]